MADTLPAVFRAQAARLGDEQALIEYDGASMTWREWSSAVDACAASLLAAGHTAGERAAVFAGNTLVWPVADLAVQGIGMVCAGIFPSSAPLQVREILGDAGITAVFTDSRARLDAVLAAMPYAPGLRTVVADGLSDGDVANVHHWADWLSAGAASGAPDWPVIDDDADAIIIYTSGSTGAPKGARISHRYLLASSESIRRTLGFRPRERVISFLPFSHAAERVFGHARRILGGDTALLLPDHRQLWDAAVAFQPTVFGGLPRFYEKIHERLLSERACLSGEAAAQWDHGLALGLHRSELRRAGMEPAAAEESRWYDSTRRQRTVIEGLLGSSVRLATSGGAALPSDAAAYLDACGLTVLGAYGLTEHLCVASHRPDAYDFTGVGPAMVGTTLRIAGDGEVLVQRCELTFSGYLDRPAETAAMFTDDGGWLRTGDLGRLDTDGRLYVTGRLKELIALSTGKKVAPAPIEARLAQDPWIAQAMLYGEGRKYITALVSLDRPVVEAWATANDMREPWDDLLHSSAVLDRVAAAVEAVNSGLSSPEQIRRFTVIDREFSEELDEITPTLKIRRRVVTDRFGDRLDALYEEAV